MAKRYKVRIPDFEYFLENIKCQYACPVRTHSGGYVTAIGEGDFEKAYTLARAPNPFAYVCGRVCGHPCEEACRRGVIDEPIAIRALKRTATDYHDLRLGHSPPPPTFAKRLEKVAIVGAGPAGLSAAHDLARRGYEVTIFEASPVAGGMLYLGIPEYRLPRNIIKMEVDAILDLGVTLKLNTTLGKDFTLDDLRKQGYSAIFLAIGAQKSKDLKIEGVDLDGVLKGVEFLLNANLGYKVSLGDKVIVIGGGNVAVDVARSALRGVEDLERLSPEEMRSALDVARMALRQIVNPQKQTLEELTVAMDVARSALRLGAKEVHMVCLESREEMPAHDWEIEEAVTEGLMLHPSLGPKKILGKEGKVCGLETLQVDSVFDSQGRFNPTFIQGTESVMETDTIIMAIGQAPDLSFLKKSDGIEVSPRGTIKVDPDKLSTTAPGIFAGGDVAFGPRLVIDAIADGQKAALSIDEYLRGRPRIPKRKKTTVVSMNERYGDYDKIRRHPVPTIPVERRMGVSEVELGFPAEVAIQEGKRCLRCNINTIFNGEKCILCGGCVDVCPMDCLKMVRLNQLEGDENLAKLILARYGLPKERFDQNQDLGTAMIKDETACIRCGLCADRCPTDAITMELFELEEIVDE